MVLLGWTNPGTRLTLSSLVHDGRADAKHDAGAGGDTEVVMVSVKALGLGSEGHGAGDGRNDNTGANVVTYWVVKRRAILLCFWGAGV